MPHVTIKCYPGRTEEIKQRAAQRIAKTVAEELGSKLSSVSVVIEEVDKEEWGEKVYNSEIKGNPDLYVKPGYNCD